MNTICTRFVLLFTLFTYYLTPTAAGQSATKRFAVGLKGGSTFSQLSHLSVRTPRLGPGGVPVLSGGNPVYDFFRDNDARTLGLVGGVFARLGNRLFVQPEVLVTAKGGTFDLLREGLESQHRRVRLTTLDLPLLVGLRLGSLRLNAGPLASLPLSDNGNLQDALQQYTAQPLGKILQQARYGYQAGGSLRLGGLQLDLRHEGTFDDLKALFHRGSTPTSPTDTAPQTSLWQITAGLTF